MPPSTSSVKAVNLGELYQNNLLLVFFVSLRRWVARHPGHPLARAFIWWGYLFQRPTVSPLEEYHRQAARRALEAIS